MNRCTINIADFRCRASKPHAARPLFRDTNVSAGLSLVHSRSEERPAVYDISEAREAQRMRPRLASRPFSFERRSNVLRFRSNEPIRLAVRVVEQPRERFRGTTEGTFDLPPAA
jgi:hypothetical protein